MTRQQILVKFLMYATISAKDLRNEHGNLPRRGVVPKFSGLEVSVVQQTLANEKKKTILK
jgi:hypothetical protein